MITLLTSVVKLPLELVQDGVDLLHLRTLALDQQASSVESAARFPDPALQRLDQIRPASGLTRKLALGRFGYPPRPPPRQPEPLEPDIHPRRERGRLVLPDFRALGRDEPATSQLVAGSDTSMPAPPRFRPHWVPFLAPRTVDHESPWNPPVSGRSSPPQPRLLAQHDGGIDFLPPHGRPESVLRALASPAAETAQDLAGVLQGGLGRVPLVAEAPIEAVWRLAGQR